MDLDNILDSMQVNENISKEAGLAKSLFKANLPFAALSTAALGVSAMAKKTPVPKAVGGSIESFIPGASRVRESMGSVGEALKQNKIDSNLFKQTFDDFLEGALEKQAESDEAVNVNDILFDLGIGAATGAGTYLGGKKLINYLDKVNKLESTSQTINKTLGVIGKNTAKTITKNKFVPSLVNMVATNAGKAVDAAAGYELKSNFSEAGSRSRTLKGLKNLGMYLALVGGATAASDFLGDKVKEEYNDFVTHLHTKASEINEEVEKIAYNIDGTFESAERARKRLLYDRVDKSIKYGAGRILGIGAVSALLNRNLYGTLEEVRPTEDSNTRVILDIPIDEVDPIKLEQYSKSASSILDKFLDKEASVSKRDIAKSYVDRVVDNYNGLGSKTLHNYQNFLREGGAKNFSYEGVSGIGHELIETIPGRVTESLAWTLPTIAAIQLFGRNPKNGFRPVTDNPEKGGKLAPGMQRIIIEEAPKEKM